MNSNLIFLTEEDLDKPVYRIFSFERLREIFDEKILTLVKPKKWDDPFENFILKAEGQMNDGRPFGFDARHHFYGQCLSLTKESDAMWRIYSPEKDGVKVKSTIRKLFTPFFNVGGQHHKANGDLFNLSCFMGKVNYKSTKFLLNMLNDKVRMTSKVFDQSGWGQASTFLFKRWAFRHEHEVRLLYYNHGDISSDFYKFPISPNEIFDEIVFDPRMKKVIYHDNKSQLVSWGYQHKIIQSGLYKLLEFKINVDIP